MIFKNYFKLFKKNLKTFFIYFGIFAFLFIILSSEKPNNTTFEEKKANILVENKDNKEKSKNFVEYLRETQNVTETNLPVDSIKTKIFRGEYDVYIKINENFYENLKNKKEAVTVIGDYRSPEFHFLKIEVDKYLNYQSSAINSNVEDFEVTNTLKNKINVNILNNKVYQKELSKTAIQNTFKILGYVILGVTTSVITNIQNLFSDEEIQKKLNISPYSQTRILIEQYFAQILISILISIPFLLLIKFKLQKELLNENSINLFLSVIIYGFTTVSMSTLFIAITNEKQVLNGLISIVSLTTAFISGIFLPEQFIPKYILAISKFFPTRYFVEFVSHSTNENLIKFIAIQLIFILFFLSSGILIKKLKDRM